MRSRDKVPELSNQYLKMTTQLKKGYPSAIERLEKMFFERDDLPESTVHTVITTPVPYNRREVPKPPSETKTVSDRFFHGRVNLVVVYPKSGNRYDARVRVCKDLAVIEPVLPNTAFWVIERKYLYDGSTVLDLNTVPNRREYHTPRNRAFLSDFR